MKNAIRGLLVLWLAAVLPAAHAATTVSIRLGGEKVTDNSKPVVGFGGTAEYAFIPTYIVGAKFSYASSEGGAESYFTRSMNDGALYLRADELLRDRLSDFTLSGTLGLVVPTSPGSQSATMDVGATEELALRKGWTARFATFYSFAAAQFNYKYRTAVEEVTKDESGEEKLKIVYNVKHTLAHKAGLSFTPVAGLELKAGGAVKTYSDFSPQSYEIYNLFLSVETPIDKTASVGFGVDTFKKDPGANETWAGPPASRNFFDAKGTVYSIASTLKW